VDVRKKISSLLMLLQGQNTGEVTSGEHWPSTPCASPLDQ
jgi:hypothetical protein